MGFVHYNRTAVSSIKIPFHGANITDDIKSHWLKENGSRGGNMSSVPTNSYELIWTPDVVFRVTTIILVMVLTIIGNSILIALILCHRKLRKKRVNIFLVNLAIGDLMVCLVTMTTEILFVAFGEWVLGAVACKVTVYGQIVTLASATFLLTGMSIDRYQVIVRPLQSLTGQPSISKKVVTAWIMAFIFAVPQLFIFVQTDEGIKADGTMKHMCRSKGYTATGEYWQRKLYFTFLSTYILIIPTIIMTFCYVNIIRVVFMRTGREQPVNPKLRFTSAKRKQCTADSRKSSSESQNDIEYSLTNGRLPYRWARRRSAHADNRLTIPRKLISSSKRKVVKMTLSVIVAFIFCWSPYFIVGLIRIFSGYSIKLKHVYSVAEILAMSHSALNPILYGVFSTQSAMKIFKNICQRKNTRRNACDASLVSDFNSLVFATNPGSKPINTRLIIEKKPKRKGGTGCLRFFNKVCYYCSCSKRFYKAKKLYTDKSTLGFLQHTCSGRCSAATTDSTFVEVSRVDAQTENDAHLQVDENGLIYRTFPFRGFDTGIKEVAPFARPECSSCL